jgi:muconate cycloisomerase
VARPYVTGETVARSIRHIREHLWPAVAASVYPELVEGAGPLEALAPFDLSLPEIRTPLVHAWHAARSAVELALIDCALRRRSLSLGQVLPPRVPFVTYSGVIGSGPLRRAVQHARYFKLFGLKQIKVKLEGAGDCERLKAIRRTLGPETSLRADANGAYDFERALSTLNCLVQFDLVSVEQPVPRCDPSELARLRAASPIPLMADESIVTPEDARALITARACDYFNLRISKCGGIYRTLRLAELAASAGVRVQLGSQVGETAILSAAGRHLAAHLEGLAFAEGSYGSLLLAEDIGRDSLAFGHAGRGALLRGPGLGVEVREESLRKYAAEIIDLRRS